MWDLLFVGALVGSGAGSFVETVTTWLRVLSIIRGGYPSLVDVGLQHHDRD
jgi:hypothetical protein